MSGIFKIIIIAGPNGAGKTTFAKEFVPLADGVFVYLNADEIARDRKLSNVAAGREMLNRLQDNIDHRNDIVFETTLAGEGYLRRIPEWRKLGYAVMLYYLRPTNVEISVQRVQRRVAAGGHDIPEAVIRQRFTRSLMRLEQVKILVDEWYVYDSLEGSFQFAQSGGSSR